MSNPPPLQAIEIISIALLAIGIAVYTKVIIRLSRDGGNVRVSAFQIPEALVAIVIASYFGLILYLNLSSSAAAPAPVNIDQLVRASMVFVTYTAGIACYLKFLRGISLREVFGINRVSAPKTVGWAVGLLICALPLIGLAFYVTQITLPKEDLAQQDVVQLFRTLLTNGDHTAIAKFCAVTAIGAPLYEEFIFRGLFYGVGKRFLGALPSGFLSALFFTAMHLNLGSLGTLFVLAVCLTLAYERTGSILVPMGMHSLFNSLSLFYMFGQAQGWYPAQ